MDIKQPDAQELSKQIHERYGSFIAKDAHVNLLILPSPSSETPTRQGNEVASRGRARVNSPEFEAYLSNLAPCASPFFTQPLQLNSTAYALPESGEAIKNTHYLAWCIQNTQALQDKEHWMHDAYQVVEAFKREDRLLELPLLRGLSVMALHRPHLTQDLHSAGDCIVLLRALQGALDRIHVDKNLEQIRTLALNRFEDQTKYPELTWSIEYIRQALARLPNNETFSEKLIRRALPAVGGLTFLTTFGLKIASGESFISGFEPDKLWEAYSCFKEAFSEIEWLKQATWYSDLCFIDVLIGQGQLDVLGKFLEKNSEPRDEAYLRGICDRLERIACLQKEACSRDEALKLLKGFKEGQITWAKQESIQKYARQSLDRIGLMWPVPDLAKMEKEGDTPAAWHPFWTAVPKDTLLSSIHAKAQQQAKQEAALNQITAIHNRLLPSRVSLTTLSIAFHRYYAKDLWIQRVSGEKASLDNCYINLAIVENQAQRENDQKNLKALAFERLPSGERIEETNPNRLIELEKLFEKQKLRDGSEGVPKRILIHGRAGIGKTTLCKKLVYEYHHNGLWQDQFDCVVWVPLRQLKTTSVHTLENLLGQYFSIHGDSQTQTLTEVFLRNHRDRTLFILDGLDEVTEVLDKRHALNVFLETLLNQVHVLITSRPSGVSASQCNGLDLELETIGFNADNVRTYIEKFVPESNQGAIQQFINRTPLIQGLVNIPIQLDALCYSWDSLTKDREVTMTKLYQAMVDKLWRKDSDNLEKKEDGRLLTLLEIEDLSESELEEAMAAEIDYLSYLAFKGLEAERIEISREELKQRRFELNQSATLKNDLPVTFTTNLKKASYLHTADTDRPEAERHYHFLHLTFQEFFAAKFLARHLQAYSHTHTKIHIYGVQKSLGVAPKPDEVEAFIATHKYNPRYEIVWWMIAGLLKGEALERFFDVLEQAPRDLIGVRHQQVLMGCVNGAKVHLKETTLAQFEEEWMHWLDVELNNSIWPYYDNYSRLGRQNTFPESLLVKSLGRPEAEKARIIRTLGMRQSMLSMDAVLALISALKDENKSVRSSAAEALGSQSTLSLDAVLDLISALKDEDEYVSYSAAKALRSQSTLSRDAVLALIFALKDENESVRYSAAEALVAHLDHHYNMLPSLSSEQIEALYSQVLFRRSCERIAALYIQKHHLHFYTATGPGHPIELSQEQEQHLTKTFTEVQVKCRAKAGCASLPLQRPHSMPFVGDRPPT
ncbi:hypothetical protein FBU30_006016 [Linnemannia zychae]|nr:hypothetical protein FBU30_006016 [Linnemannia zychae]